MMRRTSPAKAAEIRKVFGSNDLGDIERSLRQERARCLQRMLGALWPDGIRFASLGSAGVACLGTVRRWRRRYLFRQELARLRETSDHLLVDIGICPWDADAERYRPFWRESRCRRYEAVARQVPASPSCADGLALDASVTSRLPVDGWHAPRLDPAVPEPAVPEPAVPEPQLTA